MKSRSKWRQRFGLPNTVRFSLMQSCKDTYSLRRGAASHRGSHSFVLDVRNQSPFAHYIAALDAHLDVVVEEFEKACSCEIEPCREINMCKSMINNAIWLLNDRVAILYRGSDEKTMTEAERIVFICLYYDVYQTMSIFYNASTKISLKLKGTSTHLHAHLYQHKWLVSSLKCHLNYSLPRLLYRVTSYYSGVVRSLVATNIAAGALRQFLCSNKIIPSIEDHKTSLLENNNTWNEHKDAILNYVMQGILDPMYKLVRAFTAASCSSSSNKHRHVVLPCCVYLMSTTVNSVMQQLFFMIYSAKHSINVNGVRNLYVFLLNLKSWLLEVKKGLGISVEAAVIADLAPWRTANSVIQLLQFPSRIKVHRRGTWCCIDSDSAVHTAEETHDEKKTEEVDDLNGNYDINIKPTEKISWVKLRKGSRWQPKSKPEKVAVLFVIDVINL